MKQLALLFTFWPIPRIHPAGLVGASVRTRTDLPIRTLTGKPDLKVIGLHHGRTHIARTKRLYAVMQAKLLEQPLRDRRE